MVRERGLSRTRSLAILTLKKRPEFLAIRGGARASVPSFLMEARPRGMPADVSQPPRFGFTVTKKLGPAVTRNRIRRRLKSAVSQMTGEGAKPGFDYVVVARATALNRPYVDLLEDVRRAFGLIHKNSAGQPSKNSAGVRKSEPRRVNVKISPT